MKTKTYMAIAYAIAAESTCTSKQVGAIIVQDGRVISHGYNGTPAGAEHCDVVGLREKWLKRPIRRGDKLVMVDRVAHSAWSEINEIHAEQNAICFASKAGLATEGATMYVTMSPCHTCSKSIVAAGIKKVYVDEIYDRAPENWDEWLKTNGVEVIY